MIITTTDTIPGKKISQVLGIARGNTIRARHLGKDILAGLRILVGGEINDYTKLMAEAREQAMDRMKEHGQSLGANAILQVRFATSVLTGGAAEMLAYGTAAVLEDESE